MMWVTDMLCGFGQVTSPLWASVAYLYKEGLGLESGL